MLWSVGSRKKLIQETFYYLISQGYSFSHEFINNVIDQHKFSHDDGGLVKIDYDIREAYVNILVKKDATEHLRLEYDYIYCSPDIGNIKDMLAAVENRYRYFKSLRRYNLYKLLEEVAGIYAVFLKPFFEN